MTFAEQADRYLAGMTRANTVATYRSLITRHILPALGNVPLTQVGNAAIKLLVSRLAEAGLAPASIRLVATLTKQIVKSAVDAEGNPLNAVVWNDAFIGVPEVVPARQKAPVAPRQAIQGAIWEGLGEVKALVGLLAGSGLRIGEALAVSAKDDGVANFWDPQAATILVRATRVRGKLQPATKTAAGERTVALDPKLNTLLTELNASEALFPASKQTYERRFTDLGLNYGFHALRRFRVTHLEDVAAPPMLVKNQIGHAAAGITERYIKQTEERQQKAAEAGLGFEL